VLRILKSGYAFWGLLFVLTWCLSNWSFALYKALDARWIIRFSSKRPINLPVIY